MCPDLLYNCNAAASALRTSAHQQSVGPFQRLCWRAPLTRAGWEQPNTSKIRSSFRLEPALKDQAGHFYCVSQLWQKRIYPHTEQRRRFSIPTSSYSKMLCVCTKYSHNKIMTELFTKISSNERRHIVHDSKVIAAVACLQRHLT